ncbi:MAG: L,D-transpeptidase [Hyphomicrobium sp.]|nr:L,D-transpeptidase [Hyphomicrobium sp.]
MKFWSLIVAGGVLLSVTLPASAEIPGAYGMWSDLPKKSKPVTGSLFGNAPKPLSAMSANPQLKQKPEKPGKAKALLQGGSKPQIAAATPSVVAYGSGFKKGTVVVDQSQKKLYYVLGDGKAYAYPVAVGKKGFKWSGTQKVSRVQSWPDWVPPEEMRQRKPNLPLRMTGGVNNPLGARAIYLGSSLYRIHGTNDASSIGTEASSGCIRMHNGHVVHLAGLVGKGTTVKVVN